jgi:glycerol kinase
MQFQADLLGQPVYRPDVVETTALGAAGLAGIATGVWRGAAEFLAARHYTTFTPAMSTDQRAQLMAGWHRAIRAALAWVQR